MAKRKCSCVLLTTLAIVFINQGMITALESLSTLKDGPCAPVVQDGKEVQQTVRYLKDDKRSYGKPGKKSHRVMKKYCENEDMRNSPQTFPGQPRDCTQILENGRNTSGIYGVYPEGVGGPFNVYCDMETDGGGWTVFQRRKDGSVDFYRRWAEYKHGFGNLASEHWLGNDKIHRLSNQAAYELRVDLEAFDGRTRHATYSLFNVGNETGSYVLTVGGYSGNAGDDLHSHSGEQFDTRDRKSFYDACVWTYRGGWWFIDGRNCFWCNLNGDYYAESDEHPMHHGLLWYGWLGKANSLKGSEMKIRALRKTP